MGPTGPGPSLPLSADRRSASASPTSPHRGRGIAGAGGRARGACSEHSLKLGCWAGPTPAPPPLGTRPPRPPLQRTRTEPGTRPALMRDRVPFARGRPGKLQSTPPHPVRPRIPSGHPRARARSQSTRRPRSGYPPQISPNLRPGKGRAHGPAEAGGKAVFLATL